MLKNELIFIAENGGLVLKNDEIPDYFIPQETGTQVFVLGLNFSSNDEEALVKAVLRNFWMAIYKNKLVVKVEKTVIDKEHLDDLMSIHFDLENSNQDKNYDYNPRAFYDIVLKADNNLDDYKIIEEPILMDGKECFSKLYIHLKNDIRLYFLFLELN